jgi:hypothetical protein
VLTQNVPPHDRRILGKILLPRRIADHRRHRRARHIVLVIEQSAYVRLQPERTEVFPETNSPIVDFGSVSAPSLRTVTGLKLNPA